MATDKPRIDTPPDVGRQEYLETAYAANVAAGKPPYEKVYIATYGELVWVIEQRHWSSASLPHEGETSADLRGANFAKTNISKAHLFWADVSEADFIEANVSGAHLEHANLSEANLFRADISDANLHEANVSSADLHEANVSNTNLLEANMSGANLSNANLNGANLHRANVSGANLRGAIMSGADCRGTNLSGVNLRNAIMSRVNLFGAKLTGTDLFRANMSGADITGATVDGADLRGAKMDSDTRLDHLHLSSTTRLGDVRWNGAVLYRVDWNKIRQGSRLIAGDETIIFKRVPEGGKERAPNRIERLERTHNAARAYRGLGRELKDQNLSQEASWCRLSEQRMERRALFLQRRPGTFLAGIGSALLDLVSGYGEIPARTFLSYLVVVFSFAGLDYFISQIQATKLQHLTWDEALVLSLTSFHGRGFFPGALPLGDWAARLGAVEAVIGLFIELILIATFSRRFLGN